MTTASTLVGWVSASARSGHVENDPGTGPGVHLPHGFEQATPKDPGVVALCKQIVAIVTPTPGTLVAAVDGALYDDIAQRERSGCLIMISWDVVRAP